MDLDGFRRDALLTTVGSSIEGRPSAESEKCVDTPPADAYWSYWHADNGGSWRYSDKGVLNRRPPPGSFEGWAFLARPQPRRRAPPRRGTDPTGSADGPVTTDVAARRSDGLPLGTVAGALVLVALAGAGVLAARRRRAAGPDD